MTRAKLFLFVGYPGAGKTSVAKLIEQRTPAVHLWADIVRQKLFVPPTHSREESKQLYDLLNAQTGDLLSRGQSVIFDTNFNFYDDRELLRKIASDHNADAVLIWVTTPLELARKRAVEESHNKEIRAYGNMPLSDFQRIAGNLQPPQPSEQAVQIDGTHLVAEQVYQQLGI